MVTLHVQYDESNLTFIEAKSMLLALGGKNTRILRCPADLRWLAFWPG
jgi:hypothetical protein